MIVIVIICSCVTNSKPEQIMKDETVKIESISQNGGSNDIGIDKTIRDASDYFDNQITKGSKIVILNIESKLTALSNYFISELTANAVNDKNFIVVNRQQLDIIREEQKFQYSGDVADDQAIEIGKFFGAQTIISGNIRPLGNRYRLTLQSLDVQTAQISGQFVRNFDTCDTVIALSKVTYVSSRNGNVFHLEDCKWALKIPQKNKITFEDREKAMVKNRACQVCNP